MRNNIIVSGFREKVRIKILGMGCIPLVFQSVFSEYVGAITFVHLQIKVIAPSRYNKYLPAKNQATNPIMPITIAMMLMVMKPHTASPPSPMATSTNIKARIRPCAVSSIYRILQFCLLSSNNLLRDESSLSSPLDNELKPDTCKEGASALSEGASALSSSFSTSLCISFTVRKKHLFHSPVHIQRASENKAVYDLKSVFSFLINLHVRKGIRCFKSLYFLARNYGGLSL